MGFRRRAPASPPAGCDTSEGTNNNISHTTQIIPHVQVEPQYSQKETAADKENQSRGHKKKRKRPGLLLFASPLTSQSCACHTTRYVSFSHIGCPWEKYLWVVFVLIFLLQNEEMSHFRMPTILLKRRGSKRETPLLAEAGFLSLKGASPTESLVLRHCFAHGRWCNIPYCLANFKKSPSTQDFKPRCSNKTIFRKQKRKNSVDSSHLLDNNSSNSATNAHPLRYASIVYALYSRRNISARMPKVGKSSESTMLYQSME